MRGQLLSDSTAAGIHQQSISRTFGSVDPFNWYTTIARCSEICDIQSFEKNGIISGSTFRQKVCLLSTHSYNVVYI